MSKKQGRARSSSPALVEGDVVEIVAPSWIPPKGNLERGVAYLEKLGLKANYPKDIFGKDLLCCNSAENRIRHFKAALKSDSKMIWCLRGGHGGMDLLPALEKVKLPKNKIFIGFSDISAFHSFLNKNGWSTFHGTNLNGLTTRSSRLKFVRETEDIIFGRSSEIEFTKLKAMNEAARQNRGIAGPILGGNLAVVTGLIGTGYLPNYSGSLLFFEDIGERAYRIDRMLTQWQQAGLFKGVRAVVLGTFTGGGDPDGKNRVQAVWKRFAQRMKIPVLSGIECGHGPVQRPIPFNTKAVLELSAKPRLVVQTGVYSE